MKLGIELRIDVTKIDKSRLYKGEKGIYLTMTAFVDTDNQDEYGNNGMITHKKNESEERAPILGNSKVFWRDSQQQQQQQQGYAQPSPMANNRPPQHQAPPMDDDFSDDIPF